MLSGVPFEAAADFGGVIKPRFLVIHYTASSKAAGSITWLTKRDDIYVSAHVVVSKAGNITQLVALDRAAYHAGRSSWGNEKNLNTISLGIELVNLGKLNHIDNKFVGWEGTPVPEYKTVFASHKNESRDYWWETYPDIQLRAAEDVAVAMLLKYNIIDIVGHDSISPDRKIDPGPAFPMDEFRNNVISRVEAIRAEKPGKINGNITELMAEIQEVLNRYRI